MTQIIGKAGHCLCRVLAAVLVIVCVLSYNGTAKAAGEKKSEHTVVIYCGAGEPDFKGEILFPLQFLKMKQVQSELELSAAQIEKLNESLEKIGTVIIEPYLKNGYQNESYDDVEKKLDASRKRIAEILGSRQMPRFKGILVQLYGLLSLPNRDLREVLRLKPEQKYMLDSIRAQMFAQINGISENPIKATSNGGCKYVPVDNEKSREIVRKSEQSFLDLLVPDQKQTIEKLKGKPLKLDMKN